MPKYINAGELIEKLEKEYRSEHYSDYLDGKNDMIDIVKILIAEMSPAEVVEVVRCKDCKHRNRIAFCPLDCVINVADDDYCSYGERRETE